MVVTDILWMIFLFFVPGIASLIVYHYIAKYPIDKAFKFWTYSALWGMFDYTVCEFVMQYIYDIPFGQYLNIWMVFQYKFAKIEPLDTFYVTILGFFLGFVGGCIARGIKKHSIFDLYTWFWKHIKEKNDLQGSKVRIIDYKNECIYTGEILYCTYLSKSKEIVLKEASVTDFKGNCFGKMQKRVVFKSELTYLTLEDHTFSISLYPTQSKDDHPKTK